MENPTTEKISAGDIIYFELQEGQRGMACVINNSGKTIKIQGMGQHYCITHIPIGKVVAVYKPLRNWVGEE